MGSKPPVNIRRNVESFDDPYIDRESLEETSVCRECGAVYSAGRWYLPDQVTDKLILEDAIETLCPACQRVRDRAPQGVLRITGDFIWSHRDEIMNLIRNQTARRAPPTRSSASCPWRRSRTG